MCPEGNSQNFEHARAPIGIPGYTVSPLFLLAFSIAVSFLHHSAESAPTPLEVFFTHRLDTGWGSGVSKFNLETRGIRAVAGAIEPNGLAIDRNGNLYFGSELNGAYSLMRVAADGLVQNLGVIHTQPSGRISWSFDLETNEAGEVFFNHRIDPGLGTGISKVDLDGRIRRVVSSAGEPNGLAFDATGNLYFGAENQNQQSYTLMKYTPEGILENLGVIHDQSSGRASWSFDLEASDIGEVYFTHRLDERLGSGISKVALDGTIRNVVSGIPDPNGLAFDREGNLYFGAEENQNYHLMQFSPERKLTNLGLIHDQTSGRASWSFDLAAVQFGSLVPTPTWTPSPISTPTPAAATETPTSAPTFAPTQPLTPTPVPTFTEIHTPTCVPFDSGYYLLDVFGGIHRVGRPPFITGSVYFGHDFARDLERASFVEAGTLDYDLVVLDGFGGAHFVGNPNRQVMQEFYFGDFDLEAFPKGRAVDLEMTADYRGFWVLTDYGGIYRAGSSKPDSDGAMVPNSGGMGSLGFDVHFGALRAPTLPEPGGASLRAVSLVAIDIDRNNDAEGYVILDSQGGHYHLQPDGNDYLSGSSEDLEINHPFRLLDPTGYVWPFFPGLDIARDVELHRSQEGVVILDGWDGVHPVPADVDTNPVFFANQATLNDATPQMMVGLPYITYGFDDPTTEIREDDPTVYGPDAGSIFTDLEFAHCGEGLYTLDKYGCVFAFGSARANEMDLSAPFEGSTYFFPYLYAEDMEVFGADETDTWSGYGGGRQYGDGYGGGGYGGGGYGGGYGGFGRSNGS